MTDKDGDLVEELLARAHPSNVDVTDRAAARIQTLSAENERLREVLRGVTPPPYFGESEQNKAWWAEARAALAGDSHDQ